MKYIVEYAKFKKVEIDAKSLGDAKDIANTMDDEDIEVDGKEYDPVGYIIWNDPKEIN